MLGQMAPGGEGVEEAMREMHAGQPEGLLFAGVPGWGTCVPLFFSLSFQVLKLRKPLLIFSADEKSAVER